MGKEDKLHIAYVNTDSQTSGLTEIAYFCGSVLLFDWFYLRISNILKLRQGDGCATLRDDMRLGAGTGIYFHVFIKT